jgi:uncharacterized protein (TIGR03905 family)
MKKVLYYVKIRKCNAEKGAVYNMRYSPTGVCSSAIDVEVDGDIITSVKFTGGCNGNLQGISSLVTGMKIEDAIAKLRGIKCGFKNTSCPDQLACALQEILDN